MLSTLVRPLVWMAASLSLLATALAANTYWDASASANAEKSVPSATATVSGTEENPQVKPGLVKWHDSIAAAQAAAEKSSKPVLVFHLMGQLDKQFC